MRLKLKLNSLLLLVSLMTTLSCAAFAPVRKTPIIRNLELDKALSKKVKDQTFDEAVLAKNYYKNNNDREMVIKCAERILGTMPNEDRSDHAEILRTTLFELIQFCFERNNLEKAQKYALEYQTLYLATPECKEAAYYGVRSHFAATLSPDRDQSHTQKALEHAQEFIKCYPDDTEYCAPIKSIISTCYTKLLDSELQVIKSYLSRYKRIQKPALLTAAQKRVDYIQEKLLPFTPAQKDQVVRIQEQIAQAQFATEPIIHQALHHKQPLQPVQPVARTIPTLSSTEIVMQKNRE